MILEHTVYLTGSVQALRYSIQRVTASNIRKPILPDMLRVVYLRRGHCTWIIGNRPYKVNAGDIVVLNNTEKRFQTDIDENDPVEQEIIRFMPVAFPECAGCLQVFFGRKPNFSHLLTGDFAGKAAIIETVELLRSEATSYNTDKDAAMSALVRLLLIYIARAYQLLGTTEDAHSNLRGNAGNYQLICNSVNYIKEHLTEPLSVELLSRTSGISRSYYSRMFHALMGMSVPQYIRVSRIMKVSESVSAGASVIDAVFAAGFGSLSAYYKAVNAQG